MTDLYEELAAIEHERRADWQRHVHDYCNRKYRGYVIPSELVDLWQRQIDTPYADSSEEEKQKDRDQVARYWDLIPHWIPVSERLPDDGQECLYRLKGPDIDKPFGPFHGNFHKSENGFSLKGLGGWMDAADNIDWMKIPAD